MRKVEIAPGEHYHLYNRGVNKQSVCHDKNDYIRFLFLILYFQSPITFNPLGRSIKGFVEHLVLDTVDDVIKRRFVELIAFCIMPNHFHLIVKETEGNGVARYMQRVLNSYTKYFNTKYEKSGHLFQGPYQAVHIEDDRQLLHLSAYIHKNPEKWEDYGWSSYRDYEKNRWGELLKSEIVLGQFKNEGQYKKFVKTSTAKEFEEEFGHLAL